jgi:hypothetical protein
VESSGEKPGTLLGSHGKLRTIGNGDDLWDVAVEREGQTFDLLRRGTASSPTGAALT